MDDGKPHLPCISTSHTRITTVLCVSLALKDVLQFERFAMQQTGRYVQVLILEDCSLRDEGAVIIAKALHRNVQGEMTCRAKLVSLANNFITHRGAVAIARALAINSQLESLHLDWNIAGSQVTFPCQSLRGLRHYSNLAAPRVCEPL